MGVGGGKERRLVMGVMDQSEGKLGGEGIIRKGVTGWTNPEGQAWLPACVKDGLSLKGDREERREDLGREEMKYIICRPGIIQHYSYDDALLGSQRCEFGFLLPRANATSCRCRRELGEAANIFKDEQERRVCWRESHMESEFFLVFFLSWSSIWSSGGWWWRQWW